MNMYGMWKLKVLVILLFSEPDILKLQNVEDICVAVINYISTVIGYVAYSYWNVGYFHK